MDNKTGRIHLRARIELINKAKELSAARGINVSQLVTQLIEEQYEVYLEEQLRIASLPAGSAGEL